ncbi:MAG: hypothetical protein R3B54_07035 [Bdellovibrionota bacterium]
MRCKYKASRHHGSSEAAGASTIHLTEQVSQVLDSIAPSLPEGVKINADLFKQANFIELAVENVKKRFVMAPFW